MGSEHVRTSRLALGLVAGFALFWICLLFDSMLGVSVNVNVNTSWLIVGAFAFAAVTRLCVWFFGERRSRAGR